MAVSSPRWLNTFYTTHEAHFLTYGCVHLEDLREILKLQYPKEALERSIKRPMFRVALENDKYRISSDKEDLVVDMHSASNSYANVHDKINLLMLVDPGTEIPGVGYRYSYTVFYIEAENGNA